MHHHRGTSATGQLNIARVRAGIGAMALPAPSLTKDHPTIGNTLEVIKFVCRDLWLNLYSKPIDKLQTNYRVSGPGV